MRRFATVRVRITLAAVVVVGLALMTGGFWLLKAHRDALTNDVETAARLRSRDIAATVATGGFPATLPIPRGDENLVQVVDASGTVVAASANIEGNARISTLDPGTSAYTSHTLHHLPVGDTPFLVAARRATSTSGRYTIYVAASLEPVDNSTNSLARLLLIGLPALLLLVGGTTWVVTGRALRPVDVIRREVEAIGAQGLHRRVAEPRTADEIGRLARTMNAMLSRLDAANERQRRFIADASHELRSPLTGIRAQLEVDLAHPERADWRTTERDVLDDTVRLQRLVADLLALATIDGIESEPSHRLVDLDEIVLREARRLRSRARHRVNTTAVSGAQLNGNPDQLTGAVRNLLDNAARHARSAVTLTLDESRAGITLTVQDDGPGIPREEQDQIFDRFARLDNARDRDAGGTGLGLAITREVVEAHGGTITIENTPGARFTISLPTRDPQGRSRRSMGIGWIDVSGDASR